MGYTKPQSKLSGSIGIKSNLVLAAWFVPSHARASVIVRWDDPCHHDGDVIIVGYELLPRQLKRTRVADVQPALFVRGLNVPTPPQSKRQAIARRRNAIVGVVHITSQRPLIKRHKPVTMTQDRAGQATEWVGIERKREDPQGVVERAALRHDLHELLVLAGDGLDQFDHNTLVAARHCGLSRHVKAEDKHCVCGNGEGLIFRESEVLLQKLRQICLVKKRVLTLSAGSGAGCSSDSAGRRKSPGTKDGSSSCSTADSRREDAEPSVIQKVNIKMTYHLVEF